MMKQREKVQQGALNYTWICYRESGVGHLFLNGDRGITACSSYIVTDEPEHEMTSKCSRCEVCVQIREDPKKGKPKKKTRMRVKIVQINPEDDLGHDKVLHEHPVPDDGGAIVVTDQEGNEMCIEVSPDGEGFLLSSESLDKGIMLVPYCDETSLKILVV